MNLQEQFPITLGARPLRFPDAPADTATLLRDGLARLHAEHQAVTDGLLVHLAHTRFHLAGLERELAAEGHNRAADTVAIIAANLEDLLTAHQVRVDDLTDQPWNAARRDDVDLRGSQVREDLAEPRVAHMEVPIVYRGSRRLAKGAAIIETPRRDT